MEKGGQDLSEPLVAKGGAGTSGSAMSVAADAAAALMDATSRPPMLGKARASRKSSAGDLLKALLNDPGTERYRSGAKYKYTMRVALNVRELRKMLLAPMKRTSETKQAYAKRAAQWAELQRAHHAKHMYPLPSILSVGFKKVLVCALLILWVTTVAHWHAPAVEKERARVEKKEREERLCIAHMECARLAITSGWGADTVCCPDAEGEVLECCEPREDDEDEDEDEDPEEEDPEEEEPGEEEPEEGHGGGHEEGHGKHEGGGDEHEGGGGKHEGGGGGGHDEEGGGGGGGSGGGGGHAWMRQRRQLRQQQRRRLGEEAHGGGGKGGEGGGGAGGHSEGGGEGGGGEEAETPFKDSQSSTFIVIFLIVVTLFFEAGKEKLEDETPREMRGVLTQV